MSEHVEPSPLSKPHARHRINSQRACTSGFLGTEEPSRLRHEQKGGRSDELGVLDCFHSEPLPMGRLVGVTRPPSDSRLRDDDSGCQASPSLRHRPSFLAIHTALLFESKIKYRIPNTCGRVVTMQGTWHLSPCCFGTFLPCPIRGFLVLPDSIYEA